MSIPDYENKVPEKVRAENDEKMKTYEIELAELAKQNDIMKQFQ